MATQLPSHPVTNTVFIALCIQMAQSTFADVMPATTESRGPAPRAKTESPASARHSGWISRLDNWFYRQQLYARENYLAQATDIFDLEQRIRYLERRPYY